MTQLCFTTTQLPVRSTPRTCFLLASVFKSLASWYGYTAWKSNYKIHKNNHSNGKLPHGPKNKLPKVPPPVVGLENNTDAHGRERRPPPGRREPRPEARQREARRRGAAEDEQRADAEAAVALVRPEEARGGAPRRTCAVYWWWVAAMASSWGRGERAAPTEVPRSCILASSGAYNLQKYLAGARAQGLGRHQAIDTKAT